MMDISMVEKLKKKLEALKKSRSALEIEIAKKEAIISDTTDKLMAEYGVATVEDGKNILSSLVDKAKGLEEEIASRLQEAEKFLGSMP